jgi:hypothetical protein
MPQPPIWRTRVFLLVWRIALDPSGMGGPTGNMCYRRHGSQIPAGGGGGSSIFTGEKNNFHNNIKFLIFFNYFPYIIRIFWYCYVGVSARDPATFNQVMGIHETLLWSLCHRCPRHLCAFQFPATTATWRTRELLQLAWHWRVLKFCVIIDPRKPVTKPLKSILTLL